jgi:hypothetical protein
MSRGCLAIYLPHAEDQRQSVHGHRRRRGVAKKWSLSYWNDNIANVVMGGMQGADALLHPQLSRKLIKTFPDTAKTLRSSYKPRGS